MLNTQFFRGDIVVFEDDTAECPTEYMVMELFTPCDLTEEEKQDPTSLTVVTELQSILSDEDGLFDYDECGEWAMKLKWLHLA